MRTIAEKVNLLLGLSKSKENEACSCTQTSICNKCKIICGLEAIRKISNTVIEDLKVDE